MLIRLFQLILLIDLVINLSFASNEADLKESSTNKGLSLIKEEISVPKCELELYGIALFNNSSPLYELYEPMGPYWFNLSRYKLFG